MKSFYRVFSFTFARQTKRRSYLWITALVALLCLLLPPIIMSAVEAFSDEPPNPADCAVRTVLVVDDTATQRADWSVLALVGEAPFSQMTYRPCDDFATAQTHTQSDLYAVIAVLTQKEGAFDLALVLPDATALTWDDLSSMQDYLQANLRLILLQKSGMDETTLLELSRPTGYVEQSVEQDATAAVRETLGLLLPYLNIMILYFMILFYGQGVANHIMLEKTSKLMENFLIYVKPNALMFGKVLAVAAAALLQVLSWLFCVIGGFALGGACVRAINPESDMALLQFFDSLDLLTGAFSVSSMLLTVLLLLLGFLLYCALAAIGGALATKAEDLGATNILFTLVLVASFLLTLSLGLDSKNAALLSWIPFTAVLITPSQVLLGQIAWWQGALSVLLVALLVGVLLWLAAKIYRLMAFYRGNPPSPKKLLSMLKKEKH